MDFNFLVHLNTLDILHYSHMLSYVNGQLHVFIFAKIWVWKQIYIGLIISLYIPIRINMSFQKQLNHVIKLRHFWKTNPSTKCETSPLYIFVKCIYTINLIYIRLFESESYLSPNLLDKYTVSYSIEML